MNKLRSPESETLDANHVHEEYPRPYMQRDSYFCLNGLWDFAITTKPTIEISATKQILVPFPLESQLSGVEKWLGPHEYLVYKRKFTLPQGFVKDITLLHFEAVDYECAVYVNKIKVFTHKGGYLPFSFDITSQLLDGENELAVIVKDDTVNDGAATGKQKIKRGGMWYTPCSGIWQTVWAESVNEDYIQDIKITPNIDANSVLFEIEAEDPQGDVIVRDGDVIVGQMSFVNSRVEVELTSPILWTPENPHLYNVEIKTAKDRVISYFGMRKVSVGLGSYGPCLMLNNRPYFMNGVLDQGYYSDGNYTAASEQAIINDILAMKRLGFNTLRKHIKVEDRRYYYQCDKLGMLVWQDMPCGGKYSFSVMTIRPTIGLKKINDHRYSLFGRQKQSNREDFIDETWQTVKLLGHYPSVVLWTVFNEGWGQFDAKEISEIVKKQDPTRIVDHASGWFDQGGGDVDSLHIYFKPIKFKADKLHRPIVLSEFGGYAYQVKDHIFNTEKEYGYRKFESQKEFEDSVVALYENEIIPNIQNGLCAAIYTQLSDVEDEVNGFLTYDRRVLKVDEKRIHDLMDKIKF